jgi:histidinol phosphatase-like enzyme (inositol monophosphatase family)
MPNNGRLKPSSSADFSDPVLRLFAFNSKLNVENLLQFRNGRCLFATKVNPPGLDRHDPRVPVDPKGGCESLQLRTRAGNPGSTLLSMSANDAEHPTMNPTKLQIAALLASAHRLADLSGAAIRPYFRRTMKVDNKAVAGKFDPVTAADRAAERAIVKALKSEWPDHGVEGEEYGLKPGRSDYRWIIDPIDGTRAFILGFPLWGTLIGLVHQEQPLIGLMDQPYTGERFWSGASAATMRLADGRERRIKTRPCARLADAMMITTHPDMFKAGDEIGGFEAVQSATRYTRYGGDCYAYCMVAAGQADLVVEAGLKPYDIAALIPIIEKAGGRCTSWTGGSAARGGRVVAAGDPRVHDAAIKILSRYD